MYLWGGCCLHPRERVCIYGGELRPSSMTRRVSMEKLARMSMRTCRVSMGRVLPASSGTRRVSMGWLLRASSLTHRVSMERLVGTSMRTCRVSTGRFVLTFIRTCRVICELFRHSASPISCPVAVSFRCHFRFSKCYTHTHICSTITVTQMGTSASTTLERLKPCSGSHKVQMNREVDQHFI